MADSHFENNGAQWYPEHRQKELHMTLTGFRGTEKQELATHGYQSLSQNSGANVKLIRLCSRPLGLTTGNCQCKTKLWEFVNIATKPFRATEKDGIVCENVISEPRK